MSINQEAFQMNILKQEEFDKLSDLQKIEAGLNYTRNLVFGSFNKEDYSLVISDDLQCFTLQNIEVSPFPTESRQVMKFIETDLLIKFLDKNIFIESNSYSVVFVNVDDLSYHNFENILNLDHLFNNVQFQLKNESFLKKKVQIFSISGSTERILSLDKMNYYTQPLNTSQRGGKRLIFHSNQLSYSLTKMINESEFFDKKNFRHVNTVFRLNKFAPGDKKFKSHYDTPFADKSKGLYSKYTMLIYLTGNTKVKNQQPPLIIDGIKFQEIKQNSCIIFNQQLEHEGNSYITDDKIFIRTELIYKMKDFHYDEKVAQMFNMACYMTKEIDQQQYAADLFNQCVKMRYNIDDQIDQEIKKVYFFKKNLEVLYITDGNSYWFTKSISLKLIGILIILDYFNGKVYNLKNIRIKSKTIDNVDSSQGQAAIDNFFFKFLNQSSFEEEEIETLERAQQYSNLDDFIPKTLCENFTIFKCDCGLSYGDTMTEAKQLFKIKREVAIKERLNGILKDNSILIFDNLIKINLDDINIKLDSDRQMNNISSGKIIFTNMLLNVKDSINFASCNCEKEFQEMDVIQFQSKVVNCFQLPSIQFQTFGDGIKLQIDIFKNGFVYNSTKTFQQPYTNEDQTKLITKKKINMNCYDDYTQIHSYYYKKESYLKAINNNSSNEDLDFQDLDKSEKSSEKDLENKDLNDQTDDEEDEESQNYIKQEKGEDDDDDVEEEDNDEDEEEEEEEEQVSEDVELSNRKQSQKKQKSNKFSDKYRNLKKMIKKN